MLGHQAIAMSDGNEAIPTVKVTLGVWILFEYSYIATSIAKHSVAVYLILIEIEQHYYMRLITKHRKVTLSCSK